MVINKMKKIAYIILPLIFINIIGFTFAAGLVGDCGGANACKISDLGPVIKRGLFYVLSVAILVVVVMIIITGIKFMTGRNKAAELDDAKRRLSYIIIGILLLSVTASISVYVFVLTSIGVKSEFLKIFQIFGNTSFNLIEHTYAAADASSKLPNPTGVTSVYDFMLMIIRLVVRWFVYPIIVFSWFISGFLFVRAQGSPERLNYAKTWLLWTLVGTLVVLMAEGFAFALRETITQIFSS